MQDTWLGTSYKSIAAPDPKSDLPRLFLNTTSLEDGKRALVESVRAAPAQYVGSESTFPNAA